MTTRAGAAAASTSANQHDKFTFERALLRQFDQLGRCAAEEFLELLRELAGEDHLPLRENLCEFAQEFLNPIGRFVENERSGECSQRFELLAAPAGFMGQEADEMKLVGRKSAGRQRGDERASAGHGFDAKAGGKGGFHHAFTGIADTGRAGVRHEGDLRTTPEPFEYFLAAFGLVELKVTEERSRDFEVFEQSSGPPRILGGYHIAFAQGAQGAERDVLQITNGRGDEVERAGDEGRRGLFSFVHRMRDSREFRWTRENQRDTRHAKEILKHSAPVKQSIVTLDLEGVLVPEIWIAVAEKTGIKELRRTTRDEPDYDKLMRGRLKILDEHGLKLSDIQQVIGTLRPLEGGREFLDELRSFTQVILLSDTFEQFGKPLMQQLGWPTLLCHRLVVQNDRIADYEIRIPEQKQKAVAALKLLNYRVISAGDSFNDTAMLAEADVGFLFHAPDNIKKQFPQFKAVDAYADLMKLIRQAIA